MSKRTLCLFVLSAMLLPAVSQAAIVNGDFEAQPGLSGWTATDNPPAAAIVIADGYSGHATSLAHLSAAADFTWTQHLEGWQWDGDTASADLASAFFILGPGETAVTFQYFAETQGTGAEPAHISYYGQDDASGAAGYNRLPLTGTGWNTYTLELRDSDGNFLPAGSSVAIFADVLANVPSYEGTDGQPVHIQSDLYVDNFTTTGVVPEPATIVSLLLAMAGNAVYLRRRLAA